MRRPQAPYLMTPPREEKSALALEAKKMELLEGLEAGNIELRPFYWDLRNKVLRPWETVQTTRYFWFR